VSSRCPAELIDCETGVRELVEILENIIPREGAAQLPVVLGV
jgi:hypothetical protein